MVLLGVVLLLLVVFFSVPQLFAEPATFIQMQSVILVFLGVPSLFVFSSTLNDIKSTVASLKVLGRGNKIPTSQEIVDKLVELSILSQKEGRGSLEGAGDGFDDGFLNDGLQMVVNKLHPDFIRVVLENELTEIEARHIKVGENIKLMGTVAPLLGMFGTIIGIIQVLKNMRDPKTVGPSMSMALLTSMYGVFISGFIMSPIANRLAKYSEQEVLSKNIIIEGVIMIAKGDIPIKVETYLNGFLSAQQKASRQAENA